MTRTASAARHRRLRRKRSWVPAAGLAALCLVGAATAFAEGRPSTGERPSAPTAATEPSAPASGGTVQRPEVRGAQASRPKAHPAAGAPQRVIIASLRVDAPVLPVVATGRTLDPPPDPQDLGWWADGARPGAARGSALVTGHTVHDGGGALDHLETIEPGTEIKVRTARGTIRYVAESVAVLDKDTIARRAPRLFDQGVRGRLVLVTCEDWDGSGYLSNVVVTAVPAG